MARRYRSGRYKANISRATAGLEDVLKEIVDFQKTKAKTRIFDENAQRIVKSYNQKLTRAKNRGLSHLPEKQSLRELRQQFPNRNELSKHLTQLKTFNEMGSSAFDIIETKAGGKLSRYELYQIKANLKDTKEFYDKLIDDAQKYFDNDPFSIARRDYVLNLQAKRNYLSRNLIDLDNSGIKTFQKYINYANNFERLNILNYRNFLSGVTDIMKLQGYDDETIDIFLNKISELTPAQFFKMYRENDVIDKIYDIIPSPEHGKGIINSKDKDAQAAIDKLLIDLDSMIEKAKIPVNQ